MEVGSTEMSPSLVSVGNFGGKPRRRQRTKLSQLSRKGCSIASFSFPCPCHLTWSFLVLHVLMEAPGMLPVIFVLAASVH